MYIIYNIYTYIYVGVCVYIYIHTTYKPKTRYKMCCSKLLNIKPHLYLSQIFWLFYITYSVCG